MTPITESLEPAPPAARARRLGNLRTVAYWVTLGAAAGGLGGFLVGGIVGRLAMLLLRVTSDDSVRGVESDDGFIMGRFDLVDTFNLLIVATVLGAVVGLIMVLGRPFLPRRAMPFAWGAAGATAGGGLFVHTDGVDFNLLEPGWLAVLLFVLLPGAGALLIAWLVEVFPRFWWKHWVPTGIFALAVVPSLIVFPVAIAAVLVGGLFWLAMQSQVLRRLPTWLAIRGAAIAVFALVVALGVFDLVRDIPEIV